MIQISAFKKFLSFIKPIKLAERRTPIHPVVQVWLNKGRLQLLADTAIYSFEDLYTPYQAAFSHLPINERQSKSILILGFGLGSIPTMLFKHFGIKNNSYTGIENDEEILDLAKQFLDSEILEKCNLITADAFEYVVQSQSKFDVVAIDLFKYQSVPSAAQSFEFLKACGNLLTPKGVLIFNIIPYVAENEAIGFSDNFQKAFPNNRLLQVAKNQVWIGWQDGQIVVDN